jgi:GntR family transcriptional regulator/MocR family aminotransferase
VVRRDGNSAVTQLSTALPLALDRNSGTPLYRQIEKQVRDAIVDGRLRRGARLPPIRLLAKELQIGRVTAITAYEQLAAEGYVVGKTGSGTRVADHLPEEVLHASANRERSRVRHRLRRSLRPGPSFTSRALAMVGASQRGPSVMYDFSRRPHAGGTLPVAIWEKLYRRAWNHKLAVESAPGGPNPAGDLLLRQAISEYLGVTRGMRCRAEDVVVASTAQALLCAVAELWLERGRSVVVEDPWCPETRQGLELQDPTIVPVRVDSDGLSIAELPSQATVAVVTPSCQFPTGATMAMSRRLELLEWAHDAHALVVEFDFDSHFRYSGKSLPALHALDTDDRVIYIGDLGHVLFHGLGVAFAVVPESVREPLREILDLAGHAVPHVDQRAVALLFTEGHFDRNLRRLRIGHQQARDVMVDAIRTELGQWVTVDVPDVGSRMTIALRPEASLSAGRLATHAARAGVRVGQIWYASGAADDSHLSLVFAGHPPAFIWRGIRRLRAVFESA